MLLPQLTQSAAGCYAGGILCQFFNLIVVSGLTTYLGLATTGKNATTAMSLLAGIEGSGVLSLIHISGRYEVPPWKRT